MEKLFKVLESASNALRLIIFAVLITALYIIYSIASNITSSISEFLKVTEIRDYSKTNLIAQKNVGELITSQAEIDLYSFYLKRKKGVYEYTGETLKILSGKKIRLKDGEGEMDRQYCQTSISLTFGYKDPDVLAINILNKKNDNKIFLPAFLGTYASKRISAPSIPEIITLCQQEFEGNDGITKIKIWMQEDRILEVHLRQGIEAFSKYLKFLSRSKEQDLIIDEWINEAHQNVAVEIALLAKNFSEMREDTTVKSKKFPSFSVLSNRLKSLSDSKTPSVKNFQILANEGYLNPEFAGRILYPNVTLGVYVETYSTLAYSHVNELYALGIKDNEYAIQRDVLSVTYGVETVGTDPSVGEMDNIVASAPEILYRNTIKSEIGLFNDTQFENFRNRFGMSVDQYMDQQVRKAQEQAIENNTVKAKRAARKSFELQLAKLSNQKNRAVSVRYLDVQSEPPSLYDSILVKYLNSIGNRTSE